MIIPESRKAHHSQFPAIPWVYTRPVTTKGVSAAKVVATIEVPASHQERFVRRQNNRQHSCRNVLGRKAPGQE